MTIDDVLSPLTLRDFADGYLGVNYLRVTHKPARFSGLATWSDLNRVLEHARFTAARLSVVQNATSVRPDVYLKPTDESGSWRVNTRRLEELLAGGATLIFNQVDEVFPEVRALAESCEEYFRVPVAVNLYAGWRTDKGFDMHWDGHDVMILQLTGRKRWILHEPTCLHPLKDGSPNAPQPPVGLPAWQGVLEDGDLLYMPRGWWHVALPMAEPTVHLTIGLRHRTGRDLLRWLALELQEHVDIRQDVPHLRSEESQAMYSNRLRDLVASALTPNIVERFMQTIDRGVPARPRICLPDVVSAHATDFTDDTLLRLTTGIRLHIDQPKDARFATFEFDGSTWNIDAELIPALALLRQARPVTYRELATRLPLESRLPLRAILAAMLARHVLWAERPNYDIKSQMGSPQLEHQES